MATRPSDRCCRPRYPPSKPSEQDALRRYIAAMRTNSFDSTTPLYVASGMLGYNDTAGAREGWWVGLHRMVNSVSLLLLSASRTCLSPPPPSCPLHVFSGFERVAARLRAEGLCSHAVPKEYFLSHDELAGSPACTAAATASALPLVADAQHLQCRPSHLTNTFLLPTCFPLQACTRSSWRWLTCWCWRGRRGW